MPGLTGFISAARGDAADGRLERMVERLRHESLYVTGTWRRPELGLHLGWAVHPGSFSDGLPVWNERQDLALFFCGEEFSGPQSDGGSLRRLVQRYEAEGDAFVHSLNGWFCGVLVDLREAKVVLFNDRYGLGRVYWHENADGFFFASEARSLLALHPVLRELDPVGLGEQLSVGCVMQNRTLFRGVSVLPGGSRWTFLPGGRARRESYFRPKVWEAAAPLRPEEYQQQLGETFARVLPRYLRGPQPVGMSLTGGLDGRMIMAAARLAAGQLPCYTFGGPVRDCADVRLARRIAHACGQPHQTLRLGREFFAAFPELAARAIRVSSGTMDVTGAAELHVNRLARAIAPVRLTGNYGSEILRGNVAFRPARGVDAVWAPELAEHIRAAARTYDQELRAGSRLSFIAFKQVPWHHYGRLSVEQSQLTLRSPYLDNDLVALQYRAPEALASSPMPALRFVAEHQESLAAIPTDRGLRWRPVPLWTAWQHAWQELTVRAEYAMDYGMPPALARCDRWLRWLRWERLFLGRHKFCHFRTWYRDELAGFVQSVLLDARTFGRPWWRRAAVERLVREHTSGRANHTLSLHRLLSCELIHRELLENA
jgi:asparagine synthase (glutamine-hydrolysing)